jgi:hypothetical protein
MCAAEEVSANFNAMPDDLALAMLANGSDGLDRTFKAVEGMSRARGDQLKTLVIVVPTNLARSHATSFISRLLFQLHALDVRWLRAVVWECSSDLRVGITSEPPNTTRVGAELSAALL